MEERELVAGGQPLASVTDGLLRLAQDFLARQREQRPATARRARSQLIAQVDPLSGWARLHDGELLPPTSVPPALRAAPGIGALRPLTAADSTCRDLGRRRREPDQGLRELLGVVDGERCRHPGCTRRRRLHAHHVVFWSAGGATDLANLILLCPRHHTLVHALGFRLTLREDRTLRVSTAEGRVIRHRPSLPWRPAAELDPGGQISPTTLPPVTYGDRLDLHYAVGVLLQQAA